MTRRAPLLVSLTKEARPLAAAWFSCMALLGVGALDSKFSPLTTLAYGFGAITLGALSVGHEYGHRTLAFLLTQPTTRVRLFGMKVAVLLAMLVSLWLVATLTSSVSLFSLGSTESRQAHDVAARYLPLALGLCVAPWLTMACRSALAGIVFTLAIPAAALTAAAISAALAQDLPAAREALRLEVLVWTVAAVSAVGAIAAWRRFLRLEAPDDAGSGLQLPAWSTADSRRKTPVWRRHWHVQLMLKELRLQQMTFAVAALYAVARLAVWPFESISRDVAATFQVISALYVAIVALIAGALSVAEERQLGVLASQRLQSVSARRQWLLKVAIAYAVSVSLSIGVPVLLGLLGTPSAFEPSFRIGGRLFTVSLYTSVGIYASSLSSSGIRAILGSMAGLAAGFATFVNIRWALRPAVRRLTRLIYETWPPRSFDYVLPICEWAFLAATGALIAQLVWFGFINQRREERSTSRLWLQSLAIGASIAAMAFAWAGVRWGSASIASQFIP